MRFFREVSEVVLVCCLMLLSACATKTASNSGNTQDSGLEAYKKAGGRISGFEELVSGSGVVQSSVTGMPVDADEGTPGMAGITPDEDIVWAPEDDNVPMPGNLEELWKQPENKSWHENYKEAMRVAQETGKPVLIWFTDTAHSPLCRKLSDDLFSNPGFDSWASKKIVRLRIDNTVVIKDRGKMDSLAVNNAVARRTDYVKNMNKRFKVMGKPTVLILSPAGEVVARYRGYKKDTDSYYWSRIKKDVSQAEDDYGAWREKMEKRGYRMWTSRNGRKVFAKLYRYQPGKVTLISPNGKGGTTKFKNLSDSDQAWVMLLKKKYEAKKKRRARR